MTWWRCLASHRVAGTSACWKTEDQTVRSNHPALQVFEQEKKAAAEADLQQVKVIVDERKVSSATEYFCIFEDDAAEWLEVTDDHEKLTKYTELRETHTGPAPAAEIITDLADCIQPDLVDDA